MWILTEQENNVPAGFQNGIIRTEERGFPYENYWNSRTTRKCSTGFSCGL
jgi:hypothetical protein